MSLNTSEAKRIGTEKLNALIDKGQSQATAVIERIHTDIPRDLIAPMGRVTFQADEHVIRMNLLRDGTAPEVMDLHKNAFGQAMERASIPASYASHLVEKGPWGSELLADNLTRTFAHDTRKVLVRSVRGTARGILSDRYRRIDSRPMVDAFGAALARVGAVVCSGTADDTRVSLQAIIPVIFEPLPNEVIVFGCSYSNSDYGRGPSDLRLYFNRLTCLNGAIGTDTLHQIHLGKRLSENVEFSQQTYDYDTKCVTSALGDVIVGAFAKEQIERTVGLLRASNAKRLEAKEVETILAKSKLSKNEQTEIVEAYTSAEMEMIPPGQTAYRLSNAISWVAQKKDPDKLLDYQRLAGSLVMPD